MQRPGVAAGAAQTHPAAGRTEPPGRERGGESAGGGPAEPHVAPPFAGPWGAELSRADPAPPMEAGHPRPGPARLVPPRPGGRGGLLPAPPVRAPPRPARLWGRGGAARGPGSRGRCHGACPGDVTSRAEAEAGEVAERPGRTQCGAGGAAMGGSASSQLPRDLLGEYQELTFLTTQEILLAHKRFSELLPKEERERILLTRVPKGKFLTLPELRANPFQDRICRVFSTAEDGDGSMSFEDFLDMLSVFSDSATSEIKSHYAFRIFDFDDDGTLDRKDLEKLVNCLTGEGDETRLSESEMDQLIQNILEESDIDKDGTINLSEFQHVISRSPDFASSFKIVL
ncbi:calcium and integrin-binding protein 1 [Emydura macquarii macquarii]